ncbi:MAG TPA: CoA transferase [Methylomirabilota bacterium]|nr:CoA transferase [Methylomirabilota bacterium]
MSYDAPFAGLKVVDLSQGIAGPYSAMLLAQYGADVIKVEPPEGDWARELGKRYGDLSAFFVAANLGKRAIVLDLKAEEGQATLRRLLSTADVFLESYRPGVVARLGIAYPDVSALNPRIIYLSVSGFGQTGPDAERPAVDTVFQAFTGLMSVNRGLDGIPHRVPVIVMDMATALSNFQAMAVALYARRGEPRGRYIESSLLRGGATIQAVSMIQHHLEGGKPQPGLTPSGTFKASDGWINVTILRDAEFPALCDALELPAAGKEPRFATNNLRFANVAALSALLEPAFARRTTADLSARLRAARLMHQRVNTYLEFLDDPQVAAAGAVAWIEQPGLGRVPVPQVPGLPLIRSGTPLAMAPSLDQHRKEILAELD